MSVDWLQWSGYLIGDGSNSLPDVECPPSYRMEILDGNAVFRWRAILYDCLGQKMLTMLWSPKSPLVKYNLITFQVANPWFYHIEDVQRVVKLASDCFIYQFATLTRMDICTDFELSYKRKNIVKGIYYHKIVCAGKREGSLFWSRDGDEEFPHDFNFGSFKSSIRWKLYNKSKELHVGEEVEDKPYIIDAWMNNDMNKYKIWRLEVSINDFNKFFVTDEPYFKGDKLKYTPRMMRLEDVNDIMIMCIYSDLYEKRFQLRRKGHSRMANNERIYLFDLEKHKIVVPSYSKEGKSIDNSVMHNLIRVVESDECKRNINLLQSSCEALFYAVKFRNLDGLFRAYKQMEIEQYIDEKLASAGDGIKSKFI